MEIKQRQIAHKVRISEILKGEYVKEDGWIPNYLILSGGNVSRINIMGIIIAKIDNNGNVEVLIDDKTGKISVRTFDNSNIFENIVIGDVVLIIGRPREYNNEKYIVPEIIKKIKKSWFELRLVELDILNKKQIKRFGGMVEEKKVNEEGIIKEVIKRKINSDDVLNLIKRWDNGNGADYVQLVEKVGGEKIIRRLLMDGEIFEVTPGKLKAL